MRQYELALILRPSLTPDKRKKLLDTVKEWVNDAKVEKEDEWGLKPLSYKIKRETSGYYSILHLSSKEGLAMDLNRRLATNYDVLRHLLIRRK